MWKLFISAIWRDPVLTDSLYIGNHDTSQWKTEIRLSPRTSSLAQPAVLQTGASVLLKYLGKESIEGEMKALPPTVLPPEPRSPVEQSSTLVFIIPPRFSYFIPSSPRSSPTRKPFCRLVSKIVPPPKAQRRYQLFQISSHQLGGLFPSCECSVDFVAFSLLTYPIVFQQDLLNEYVKANPGRHGQRHGNGIHQSWQLVHLCFLFSGFLPKLLLILDSFSVLIPLPCYRHELFFTISFINFPPCVQINVSLLTDVLLIMCPDWSHASRFISCSRYFLGL